VTTLDESYTQCRDLTKSRGKLYFGATYLLPRVKRHHVHALYAFCRHADDLVDRLGPVAPDEKDRVLTEYGDEFFADLDRGDSDDPVLKAVVHTVTAFDLNPDCFRRYLRSMSMDLTVSEYETFDDLLDYMDGSAAVIGEMMLPILEPSSAEAIAPAHDLGVAFQLTAFLRDVGADLDRGRVYLPLEDLQRFGADPWARKVTPEWKALMAFEIGRAWEYYESADRGMPMLPAPSARAIRAARNMNAEILEAVERAEGDLFSARARVPRSRQAFVVGRSLFTR
jgi:15-cis-phytoene synthase